MKDDELEKTKPIKPIVDVGSREEKYEDILDEEMETREEKYQKMVEEEEAKEAEEEAEIALVHKNIEMAEDYEAEELAQEVAKKLSEEDDKNPKKKEKPLKRLKNWWKSLDKGQKIIYGLIGLLFFLLFVLLIVGAVALLHKEKPKEEPVKEEQTIEEEQAPIMFDNYYYKDGTLVFLSEGGSEIGSYTCDNKSELLCSVAVNNYRDVLDVPRVVDEAGNDITEYVAIVNDDYVFINDTDSETTKNIVLYSIKKQEKIATYHDVKAYDDGYYVVSNTSNEYGLIQITDQVKELIKYQYSYLGMIDKENYLVAKENKGFIMINKKDNGVSKHINTSEVKYYNNNFIVTKDEGVYSVYDYKGKQLETGYTFATVRNKYMFLIEDKKVYVKDVDGNKFNEQGVELKNLEYLKSYVYGDNGDLAKTKRSFELEVKGDNIAIAVYDLDYDNPQFSNLNILEGNLNKTLEYVSYFDGKLYFYSDLEKKELLGSYQCTYKNEITSKSTEYTDCFVAKDTIFEDNDTTTDKIKNRKTTIPLINNKYVFISDDNNVVLFDLGTETKKSTYTSVNTYYDDNEYKFGLGEGRFDVVALNRKGKYGVIRIDGSSVASLHSFVYNKVEMIGDYFIAEDTNGKWLVLDGENKEGIYPNKIMGFTKGLEYVKTGDGNKYNVYKYDGTPVTKETYYYVELFNNEYAAVGSDRNVTVYSYEGKKLTDNSVKIPSNVELKRTNNQAIKLKRVGDVYTISVYNGSKYVEYSVPVVKEETPEQPKEKEEQ